MKRFFGNVAGWATFLLFWIGCFAKYYLRRWQVDEIKVAVDDGERRVGLQVANTHRESAIESLLQPPTAPPLSIPRFPFRQPGILYPTANFI